MKQKQKLDKLDTDESSSFDLSEFDDKEDPNYFKRDDNFYKLPLGVQQAVEKSMKKAKHSAFYY